MDHTKHGFERILVATDFSPCAEAATQQALWLARRTRAALTLTHVLPNLRHAAHPLSGPKMSLLLDLLYAEEQSFEEFEHESRRDAEADLRRSAGHPTDIDVSYQTLQGEPIVEITHAVQQAGFDLVFVGMRGIANGDDVDLGVTARRLIRKCPAAVWIAKAGQVGPPRVLLAATDFSDVSWKAVSHGLWLARQADAAFHLLHVIDSRHVPANALSRPEGGWVRQQIEEQARQRLESFLASLSGEHVPIQTHCCWGTPWEEIGRIARQLEADLIVLGTVGRSGIRGLLLGNTAEKVLAQGDCSMLTVKPDGFVSPL